MRQEVAEQIAELEALHDELIGHLKAIQEAQTDLWLQRWDGDRVAKAQMAKERDMAMLRTNFARRAAGQDVEPLGRSAESKQLLVKAQIADLRWKNSTRLSAGGVADKWVTQLLRQSDAKVFKKSSDQRQMAISRASFWQKNSFQ